jgi:hypothetical protein
MQIYASAYMAEILHVIKIVIIYYNIIMILIIGKYKGKGHPRPHLAQRLKKE